MSERSQLLTRKRDIFAALRVLEDDYRDGAIDAQAYETSRRRYELEAADLLRRLDQVTPEGAAPVASRRPSLAIIVGATVALVAAAMAIFLVTATHNRSGTLSITGDAGTANSTPVSTPTPKLRRAEQAVLAHPRDYTALLALGNAYVETGDSQSADNTYLRAAKLLPSRPEAPTMHAMMLGASGQDQTALSILSQVERNHPTYSRAFLLEGIVAAHSPTGYTRALRAWKRFLLLNPKGTVAARVRQWIVGAEKAMKKPAK